MELSWVESHFDNRNILVRSRLMLPNYVYWLVSQGFVFVVPQQLTSASSYVCLLNPYLPVCLGPFIKTLPAVTILILQHNSNIIITMLNNLSASFLLWKVFQNTRVVSNVSNSKEGKLTKPVFLIHGNACPHVAHWVLLSRQNFADLVWVLIPPPHQGPVSGKHGVPRCSMHFFFPMARFSPPYYIPS